MVRVTLSPPSDCTLPGSILGLEEKQEYGHVTGNPQEKVERDGTAPNQSPSESTQTHIHTGKLQVSTLFIYRAQEMEKLNFPPKQKKINVKINGTPCFTTQTFYLGMSGGLVLLGSALLLFLTLYFSF